MRCRPPAAPHAAHWGSRCVRRRSGGEHDVDVCAAAPTCAHPPHLCSATSPRQPRGGACPPSAAACWSSPASTPTPSARWWERCAPARRPRAWGAPPTCIPTCMQSCRTYRCLLSAELWRAGPHGGRAGQQLWGQGAGQLQHGAHHQVRGCRDKGVARRLQPQQAHQARLVEGQRACSPRRCRVPPTRDPATQPRAQAS